MQLFLRIIQAFIKLIYLIVYRLLNYFLPGQRNMIPPIKNQLLTLSLRDLTTKIRKRELKSIELVEAYIDRIQEVNPYINAVVQERFHEACQEAHKFDDLVENSKDDAIFKKYPLLGMPFTVKESCGLKDMSFEVGSLQRVGMKSPQNGDVVQKLRLAGAIPLLVSSNPEYCFSIETNSYTNGRTLNAYDKRKTSGGSSGGEGALNGAGATLFGVGSDIAGSIRIPSLFNGIFGHKPTGGLTSVKGLFPDSSDIDYDKYLQVGPMTRFACDLSILLDIMVGTNSSKLELLTPIELNTIRVYYSLEFPGLNGLLHPPVTQDIKSAILKAVEKLNAIGIQTRKIQIDDFENSTEIALGGISSLKNMAYLINDNSRTKIFDTGVEFVKSLFGKSLFTKEGLIFELMRRTNAFMKEECLDNYKNRAKIVRFAVENLLGDNGVLFFPTFPVPAIHHNSSILPLWGIDYSAIFNVLGLPATHVPMGLDGKGLPVGFQIVAAPYKDKLCIQVAEVLEQMFGGWVPPMAHFIK